MDNIDKIILEFLKENSRYTHQEIGKKIHMSGQAVGLRISKMVESGTIKKFTIQLHDDTTQFIRLFLDGPYFTKVQDIVLRYNNIEACYQTSGQACYIIIAHFSRDNLNHFLNAVSPFARYTVESVITS